MSDSTELPRCTDCKWMALATDDKTRRLCVRPDVVTKNVVTGGILGPACEEERVDQDWLGNFIFGKVCGVEAKYFQPIEKL